MPAKRKPSSGTPQGAPAAAPEPVEATGADPEPDTEAAEAVPMNRAERRARGKGSQAVQPTVRGKTVGSHGPAHTHRNWASRRSGG